MVNIWVGVAGCGAVPDGLGRILHVRWRYCGPRARFSSGSGGAPPGPDRAVNTAILLVVVSGGWAMGAPIGIGTVVATFGIGVTMQIVFRLLRFEPRSVDHRSLFETTRAFVQG